jgi:hypothetical protein
VERAWSGDAQSARRAGIAQRTPEYETLLTCVFAGFSVIVGFRVIAGFSVIVKHTVKLEG